MHAELCHWLHEISIFKTVDHHFQLGLINWVYFLCFILISWGCLTSPTSFFFGCKEPIWLAHCQKKLKLWRLPKIEDSLKRWSVSALWPSHIGEKWRTLGRTYGIKARCYWEHPWGTHWELTGPWKEHIGKKKEKWKKSPPPPKLKGKIIKALWVHAEHSHWLHKISMFQNC